MRVNDSGTRAVLDALVKSKRLKRFIYISTVMVFEPTGKKARNEKWPRLTFGDDNNYVETKLMALKIINEYSLKIPVITLYPSIVIDANEITGDRRTRNNNWHNLIRNMIGGGVPGVVMSMLGDKVRVINFIFLTNLVEAMINATHKGKVGDDYILGGQNITTEKYICEIERIKGRKFLPIRIPLWLLKLIHIHPPMDMCFNSQKAVLELGLRISKLSDY
ncbi:SDR family oxidoreductase [Patescibacteria group bacterium]|nr:SDR family oxidoreductase [Patescibacteria group bacterium]